MGKSKYDNIFTESDKEKIRDEYVIDRLSIRDICKKYGIKNKTYVRNILKPVMRNFSEASVVAHKKNPEKFKHSDETKQKIRDARLKYMKEHPENTAWRKRNLPSYPEDCFIKFLIENGYDKKFLIEKEYCVFPFYIDFAFVDIKVAVEIDGSQHILDEERKKKDEIKDNTLIENGWRVIRISENVVKTDWETLLLRINDIIGNESKIFERVGIIKAPKTHQKVDRNERGLSLAQEEMSFKQRKVKDRPEADELLNELLNKSFTAIGRKYNVCDNTIRKWCKYYKLPYRKKDLIEYKKDNKNL